MIRIHGDVYALRICEKSTDVGFRRDCITAHDHKGRSVGWYLPVAPKLDPQPFRSKQMKRWEEPGAFPPMLKEKELPPIPGMSGS